MDKLIIEVAMNETVLRDRNPYVPYTPEEIAQDAYACYNAGASIVHFHARDAQTGANRPQDVELTAEALARVREKCDVIFYPTYDFSFYPSYPVPADETLRHVRELAVHQTVPIELHFFAIGSTNWGRYDAAQGKFVNDDVAYMLLSEAETFLRFCLGTGVKPFLNLRELGHVRQAMAYREIGLLKDPIIAQFRFTDTQYWGPPPDAQGILSYLSAVPPGVPFHWFVNCYGQLQHRLNALAIAMGGHARTGIGSLPTPSTGPERNVQMVERLVRFAREIGREIATPAEARAILGIGRDANRGRA
jgi:3-keto-5-aminohexanoate cleavage enzyme